MEWWWFDSTTAGGDSPACQAQIAFARASRGQPMPARYPDQGLPHWQGHLAANRLAQAGGDVIRQGWKFQLRLPLETARSERQPSSHARKLAFRVKLWPHMFWYSRYQRPALSLISPVAFFSPAWLGLAVSLAFLAPYVNLSCDNKPRPGDATSSTLTTFAPKRLYQTATTPYPMAILRHSS